MAMMVGAAGYALASFFIFTGPGRGCAEQPATTPTDAVPVEA